MSVIKDRVKGALHGRFSAPLHLSCMWLVCLLCSALPYSRTQDRLTSRAVVISVTTTWTSHAHTSALRFTLCVLPYLRRTA